MDPSEVGGSAESDAPKGCRSTPAHPTHDAPMPSPVRVAGTLGREKKSARGNIAVMSPVPAPRGGGHFAPGVLPRKKAPRHYDEGAKTFGFESCLLRFPGYSHPQHIAR